ncbi:sugar phosphate nucleotidyltransferase [Streptomyces sp. ok210]|uniref:sugar phosphate nucleotidyltransferase n=1 Tax=Streptomyces sp. ok210 TaxID=1761905 RepID=UPI0008E026CA|nr:sugar phosphate nucleotidyltransferase [Streptomyces sp. ok210]SFT31432.1 UTP--glucose-1-phosphate uridylyltransferase [Streptomyces sp. ok210]
MSRAVIAVAGMGSRFFPVAKSLNKCMLPVLEQPVLAYAVADCLAAGVCEIAIVIAAGESGRQVRHYFTEDHGMREYFAARGWQEKYEPIAHLHDQADFTFIEQPRDGDRYGTALPAILAADFIADQDFFLIAGDDLLLRPDGGSDLADLAAASIAAGTRGAVAAATVPGTDAHRYGVLSPRTAPGGQQVLDDLLEKQAAYSAPTAFINISRSWLPADAIPYFEELAPAANGEYQANDAISAFARDRDVLIHPVTGRYFDCGNTAGWVAANIAAARAQGLAVPGLAS